MCGDIQGAPLKKEFCSLFCTGTICEILRVLEHRVLLTKQCKKISCRSYKKIITFTSIQPCNPEHRMLRIVIVIVSCAQHLKNILIF